MHIVMLSDQESVGGGAAIAASRLADGLIAAGHKVTRIVGQPDGRPHDWQTVLLGPERPMRNMVVSRLIPSPRRWQFARRTIQRRLDELLAQARPDIVNVHNLHAAAPQGWSPEMLRVCASHAPVAWTLHDMWSFTGRCAYARACRKFPDGCDATCPTPGEYPQLPAERIAGAWKERQSLFAETPGLVAITPSRWLASEAALGCWRGHRVEVIPNGLDLQVFEPLDRLLARQALGVHPEGPVLLMAAAWLNDPSKGGSVLLEALSRVESRPLTLFTLGEGRVAVTIPGVRHHSLGRIDHPRSLALAYNAADLFVHAAPADNLPNTIVEAMACGTPTVAFAVGGVPELVCPGVTGWLADEHSSASLAHAIDHALTALAGGTDLRASCRSEAKAKYPRALQAGRYVALFASLIGA